PGLGAVHVSAGVPNARPARLVRVSRTGGGRRNLVQDDAQVTAECWAPDSVSAAALCRLVRALLGSMDTGSTWFAGEVGGPVDHPDDLTDSPRYQTTVTLRSRGVAIEDDRNSEQVHIPGAEVAHALQPR